MGGAWSLTPGRGKGKGGGKELPKLSHGGDFVYSGKRGNICIAAGVRKGKIWRMIFLRTTGVSREQSEGGALLFYNEEVNFKKGLY